MTSSEFGTILHPDLKPLLLGAAAELTATLVEQAVTALGTAVRGTPQAQALREAYTQAGAVFLTCLDLPEDPDQFESWKSHVQNLLAPVFRDGQVQAVVTDSVLHEGRPEAIDPTPFQAAWVKHHGKGAEVTLPWREGLGLREAVQAFAEAFEHQVEAQPELHSFLLAARLKRAVERLESGVRVEGMEDLLEAVRALHNQQVKALNMLSNLARWGISVQGDGNIIGDHNKTIVVKVHGAEVLLDALRSLRTDLTQSETQEREALLAEYRAQIRRTYAQLDLKGLTLPLIHGRPLDPALVRIPLDRVYIKLRALRHEEKPGAKLPSTKDADETVRYIRGRQRRWRMGEQMGREVKKDRSPIPLEQAVAKHERLVILGDPGAGKSTSLHHLAWSQAADQESLPLLVPLGRADVAIEGGRSMLGAALDILTGHKTGEERETLRSALEERIAEKGVLWLWDGLDEVRFNPREVVETLGHLAVDGHQMVVTSRPLGYEPIVGCDNLYKVPPLSFEEAETFVDRWFQALAEARQVSEQERKAWAEERSRWLKGQIEDRPGLQEVSRNPLMLTFLAVLAGDEPRQDFPRYRKDLYARYIERLLTAWEAQRRGGEGIPLLDGFADPNEARETALWGFRRIALHLHRAYGERPEGATRQATREALAADLAREMEVGRLKARGWAEAVLAFWERAGLLDRYPVQGQEWLAFRHVTFQEYGAARALVEAYVDARDDLWAELKSHILEDDWAQVIVLALAHLRDATPLLTRFLNINKEDKSEQQGFLRAAAALTEGVKGFEVTKATMQPTTESEEQQRALLLAGRALAEGAEAAEAIERRVVDGLEGLARTLSWDDFSEVDAFKAVSTLRQMEEVPYAAERLLALAQDGEIEIRVRIEAVKGLEYVGRANDLLALAWDKSGNAQTPTETNELLAFMLNEGDEAQVRSEAIKALERLGRADSLFALVQDKGIGAWGRIEAAEALGHLGCPDKLLALARDRDIDACGRVGAAIALKGLGRTEEAIPILLALARNEKGEELMRFIASLGCAEQGAPILLTLARDEEASSLVRIGAAKTLSDLGQAEEAVPILVTLARNDELDSLVRFFAASTLSDLNQAEESVPILLALSQDKDVDIEIRIKATAALGSLGRADEAASIFLALARDEEVDAGELIMAIGVLDRLSQVENLMALAQDEKVDGKVRVKAAEALSRLGPIEKAVTILLSLIQDEGQKAEEFAEAIRVLERLSRTEDLIAIARDEKVDGKVRVKAAEALSRLGQSDKATSIFLALARDEEVSFVERWWAVQDLAALGQPDDLLAIAQDEKVDAEVRVEAAVALGRLGCAEEAISILLALAYDEGVDGWECTQAIIGLGRLGQTKDLLNLARDASLNAAARLVAASELGFLGRTENFLALIKDAEVDVQVRVGAVLGMATRGQAEDLLALVRDKGMDAWVRGKAAWALGRLGYAEEAIPILLALSRDENIGVRTNAMWGLGDLGQTEELLALARKAEGDDWVRFGAVVVLAHLSRTEELLTLIQDAEGDIWVRVRTIRALGRMDCADATPEVLFSLRALAQDATAPEEVREAAQKALKQMTSGPAQTHSPKQTQ
jgi:HEAT repeat protein